MVFSVEGSGLWILANNTPETLRSAQDRASQTLSSFFLALAVLAASSCAAAFFAT